MLCTQTSNRAQQLFTSTAFEFHKLRSSKIQIRATQKKRQKYSSFLLLPASSSSPDANAAPLVNAICAIKRIYRGRGSLRSAALNTVNRPRSAEFLVAKLLLLCTWCDVVPRISKSVISLQPHSRSVYSTLFSFNFISHSSVLLQRCGECESKRKPYHPRVAIQHPRCAADFKSQRRC